MANALKDMPSETLVEPKIPGAAKDPHSQSFFPEPDVRRKKGGTRSSLSVGSRLVSRRQVRCWSEFSYMARGQQDRRIR